MAGNAIHFTLDISIAIEEVIAIANDAGEVILQIYNQASECPASLDVEQKADLSPLTVADREANALICQRLEAVTPHVPIVSEEKKVVPYEVRRRYQWYWLVDPLDGTKEFIKRNGQFTVNIALMHRDRPHAGVVHTPCRARTHWAVKGHGAFVREGAAGDTPIKAATFREDQKGLTIVGSLSHSNAGTEEFVNKYRNPRFVALGSSLKLLLVAEGEAHVYPRLGPTCEWDTAAAQAIVEEAGGEVLQYPTMTPLVYSKEVLLNPYFVVFGQRVAE